MKQILLLLIFGISVQFTIAQVPTNDSVADATEITSLNYFEEDIRLDLAEVNTASPIGCNTNGFTGVFYKFTASTDTFIDAKILAGSSGGTIINSFVIVYTAPNLNASSASELTHLPQSACVFGTQTGFDITTGQSYYIMVHRSDAGALSSFSFSQSQDVPQAERDALVDFFNSTNGNTWSNNTNWNTATPVPNWFGIITSTINGTIHVTGINLPNNNVSGTLTNNLDDLPFLNYIDLQVNQLTGSIPDEIGNIFNLNFLRLNTNNLSGSIPTSLGNLTNLNYLFLGVNNLTGGIPAELGNLSQLFWLLLSDNPLGGTIPPELGNLTSLVNLDLRATQLTGTIPPEIGNLTNLAELFLFFNNLEGSLPTEFNNLTNLINVNLNGNNLEGNLPSNLANFSNLQFLNIADNNFSGIIPDLTSLPLALLWIQNNNFTFESFENQFNSYQNSINNFQFIPQAKITEDSSEFAEVGDNLVLETGLTSPNNQYLWFFNGVQIADETESSLTLNNIQAEQMGNYFCYVNNSIVQTLTLQTGEFVVGQDPTTSPDYNILVDLYNATNGINWSNNTNWLDPNVPLAGWHGITTSNNNVTGINLAFNNLEGTLPNSLTNLSSVSAISVGYNNLSGTIPDFSVIPSLNFLDLLNNDYSFLDFEPNFTNNTSITTFAFSPQNPVDNEIIIDAIIGDNYSIPMTTIDGTEVNYQWYTLSKQDGSTLLVNGQDTNTLEFNNLQSESMDNYTCIATSPLVPGLEVRRNAVELRGPVSQAERDALIAIYNATNGPSWSVSTNWNTTAPVHTWAGITTSGNKVSRLVLQGNGLVGTLPPELTDLVNLEGLFLGLGDVGLTGQIPNNIGDLSKLKSFWIQGTGLTGEIPESIGDLVDLKDIRFLANNFTGELPSSISNLINLTSVIMTGAEFFGNRSSFSGPIPFNAPNANIDLSSNNFDFGDLEPFVTAGNYNSFNYSPQLTDDIEESITSNIGEDVTLNVNDTDLNRNNATMNNQYQWFKDDVAITGANASSYTIFNAQTSDDGVYHCEINNPVLPDLTIVRADITLMVSSILGIDNPEDIGLSIYPNPTSNWINIKSHELINSELKIFDMNGRLVLARSLSGKRNAINIENLQNGTYLLQLTDNGKSFTERFIKQ